MEKGGSGISGELRVLPFLRRPGARRRDDGCAEESSGDGEVSDMGFITSRTELKGASSEV